jgi:hypothetical protein
MARRKILSWFGAGLALWLAWAAFAPSSQADAVSESPFTFDPPIGWAREVGPDGRVNYHDPESPSNCFIQILPVVPEDLSRADEVWLRQYFDAFLRRQMSSFERKGISIPYDVEPSQFERSAPGVYFMYKRFTIPVGVEGLDHQAMILLKNGSLQRLFSFIDIGRCRRGSTAATRFFETAADNIRSARSKPLLGK